MNKAQLISKVLEYNASIVWDIDSPLYYPLIGWSGQQDADSTYWLEHELEGMTNDFIKNLLKELADSLTEISL